MSELTRRTFFKGAAALGAAAMLGGCAPQEMKESETKDAAASGDDNAVVEVKHAWCKMCGPARTHCSTLCTIKDGRWVHVEGNPEAGNNYGRGSRSLCAKGNAAMHTVYSPTRLLYPMKRTGEKGEGKFEQITWDQALDEIAAKLKEQKEQYGAESYGVLSPQYYAVLGSLGRRFLNVHGSPNYLHSAICNSQRMFSRLVTIGGPCTARPPTRPPGSWARRSCSSSGASTPRTPPSTRQPERR
ncbi:molybdopterin-dependent oxidoreductase [Eggerthella sinensis]|uniref:molybdopterin-dependent oxidoreductase n=1 Tax=Eggerthella sinensis TaxID=242230 RepID=UPI0022E394DC|nr:molybdopterin-dependent oxidoreductase [Eggerthella sinensis]